MDDAKCLKGAKTMTDRERLTALLMAGAGDFIKKNGALNCTKLADYLVEHGVTVPPCKVGDRLYEVTGRKTVSVYKVRAIRVELFSLFIEWDIVEGFVWKSLSGINANEIGKTVFLTREEAEKVLKEWENNV